MGESHDQFSELLAKLNLFASDHSDHIVRAHLKLHVMELEKATLCLYDLIMTGPSFEFFFEVYDENVSKGKAEGNKLSVVRYSPYYMDIIRGLIIHIKKYPGRFSVFSLSAQELKSIRFVPGHFKHPILIAYESRSEVEGVDKVSFDLNALSRLTYFIANKVLDKTKYTLCPVAQHFSRKLRDGFSSAPGNLKGKDEVISELLGHIALKDHQEIIKFIKDIHVKILTDADFSSHFLASFKEYFRGYDLKAEIPKATILEVVYKSSKFEETRQEKIEKGLLARGNESDWSKARTFVFYSRHIFEHGKKEKVNASEEETAEEVVWFPMDLELAYYSAFGSGKINEMYISLVRSNQLHKIPIPDLQ